MEEKIKKSNKWVIASFLFSCLTLFGGFSTGIIGTGSFLPLKNFTKDNGEALLAIAIFIFFISPVLGTLSGITALTKKENKQWAVSGILLNVFLFLMFIISLMSLNSAETGYPADSRIFADMSQVRSLAEVYFGSNNSYKGFDSAPEISILRQEILKYKGSFALNIKPDGSEYCAEAFASISKRWACVDSEFHYNQYSINPKCSEDYYACD